jgi:hypothetical protein
MSRISHGYRNDACSCVEGDKERERRKGKVCGDAEDRPKVVHEGDCYRRWESEAEDRWSRTSYCFPFTTGLVPLILENVIVGDEVKTDLEAIETAIKNDPESIVCVYTTTSCFAPRVPDACVQSRSSRTRFHFF